MSTHENNLPKGDVDRKVTDGIVDAIEPGIGLYRTPWRVRQDRGFNSISVGSSEVTA